MKKNNKASVIIYVLILTSLSLILAVIVMDNFLALTNNKNYYDIETKLLNNINFDGKISVNYDKKLNNDGSGFIDNISCPTNFTMSGTTNKDTNINTSLYISGSQVYCSGSYNSNNLRIYFNSGATDFNRAKYDLSYIIIGNGRGNFSDSDSTKIDFNNNYPLSGDNYDDNLNSDNYIGTSTGVINYPNDYLDNDDLARKTLIGYVPYTSGFKKVFWNNNNIINFINKNINNTGSLVDKIGVVGSGVLYLDIDKAYELKLVEFDRNLYSEFNELHGIATLTGGYSDPNIGYLQNNGSLANSTINAYNFDFKNKDYALFLRTTGTGTLLYKIKAFNLNTNNGVYINPIDDSDDNIISYLGGEIFIDKDGQYISKQSKILFSK